MPTYSPHVGSSTMPLAASQSAPTPLERAHAPGNLTAFLTKVLADLAGTPVQLSYSA